MCGLTSATTSRTLASTRSEEAPHRGGLLHGMQTRGVPVISEDGRVIADSSYVGRRAGQSPTRDPGVTPQDPHEERRQGRAHATDPTHVCLLGVSGCTK